MSNITSIFRLVCFIGHIGLVHSFLIGKANRKFSVKLDDIPVSVEINEPVHQPFAVLDQWRDFECLRNSTLEEERLGPFFAERPSLIVQRLAKVSSTLYRAQQEWQSTGDDEAGSYFLEESEAETRRANTLCETVSSLGPVAVKIGQTLSQRPDLVGDSAAKALKQLQTKNVAYDNEIAYAVIHESLNYRKGPLAPGIETSHPDIDPHGPPLFSKMTPDPVACASLGQVYRATTVDGKEVAVKVQRPDAITVLASDVQCFRIVFRCRSFLLSVSNKFKAVRNKKDGFTEAELRGNQTIGSVIDRVARDIKKELDYRLEAKNSDHFRKSLDFLGFVTTPDVVQATDRVILTEWANARHLDKLSTSEGLAMTRMAVEACTASMVLTGFVHADPHEGNLMLHDDGRIVFLDFGLMSDVDSNVMEGFARGIQALLSEDWTALTEAFSDVGFVTTPIMHRSKGELWRSDPKFGLPQLTEELKNEMETTEGGTSRFGALATVLNKGLSPRWLLFTPPYVLLLIRTFLTLEGIAASIDPDFNIYEMASPWAIQRSLSPSTKKGFDLFRSSILTENNRIQWQRLLELTNVKNDAITIPKAEEEPRQVSGINKKKRINEKDAAKKTAMKNAMLKLLGSSDGKALRKVLKDMDSVDLLSKLSSRDGRLILQMAGNKAAQHLLRERPEKGEDNILSESQNESIAIEDRRPLSETCTLLRERQLRWTRKVIPILIKIHAQRCLSQIKGLKAIVKFFFVGLKVMLLSLIKESTSKIKLKRKRSTSLPA